MAGTVLAALAAVLCNCGKSPARIVVGSQNGTGQIIAGEIVAQHLEHRLAAKVDRRLGLNGALVAYQELQLQHISVYPAFTGEIEADVLRERANPDPAVVWERTHNELSRIAKMELLNPLGYENPPTLVVAAADAAKLKAPTLTQAAAAASPWKIGVAYNVLQRTDFVTALNIYNLPTNRAMRGVEPSTLFPLLQKGDLTMIVTESIDARLAGPAYRALEDDRHAFAPDQACLLTRADVLAAQPQMRAFLAELSGKFSTEGMRKMSAEVDLDHRPPADVAAEFLAQAGLK